MAHKKIVPGTGGEHYIPYKDRSGEKSTVYFTEDLSAEGLKKIFERVSGSLKGKIAVKLHTGEQHGPNIIPAPWVKELIADKIPEAHINVLRNMSVSCDCEGVGAAPVVTPNIGIVASTDILAADQASVDLVYALKDSDHKDLVERIETRHGLRQLSYMKEMHMGNDRYHLINIDEDDKEILPADAVKNVKPFQG